MQAWQDYHILMILRKAASVRVMVDMARMAHNRHKLQQRTNPTTRVPLQFTYLARYLGTPESWSPYLERLAARGPRPKLLQKMSSTPPLLLNTLRREHVDPAMIDLLRRMTILDP